MSGFDGLVGALLRAFVVGGLICVAGQLLFDLFNLTPAVSMSILVSAGSACASHKQKVSAVLTGMGIPAQTADCALRISLCPGITEEQLNYTVDRIAAHYAALSRFTRR